MIIRLWYFYYSLLNRRWNSEPNDWFGNEDCAAILIDGVYNDMDCTAQTGFICEYLNIVHKGNS